MYGDHRYLDQTRHLYDPGEADAAYRAQNAERDLGRDHVAGRLNEAAQFGQRAEQERALQLEAEAWFYRDTQRRQWEEQAYWAAQPTAPPLVPDPLQTTQPLQAPQPLIKQTPVPDDRPRLTVPATTSTPRLRPTLPSSPPRHLARTLRRLFLLGAVLLVAWLFYGNYRSSNSSPQRQAACPRAEVAPLAGAQATLTEHFSTDGYEIYICQAAGHGLYYSAYRRVNPDQKITLPATEQGGAYVAVNGGYTYLVDASRLLVKQGSQPVVDQQVRRASGR